MKVCRHCRRPITYETRQLASEARPRTGWWDDTHVDQHICFRALLYRHAPQDDKESTP